MSPVTQELIDWHVQTIARSRAAGEAAGEARGEAQGEARGIERVAKAMISDGADDAYVSRMTGLDGKAVKKLRASMRT